jgi:hypothetical protein
MRALRPKEQHERLLADADKEKIVQHQANGQDQEITKIAVMLARQCDLFVHFQRLWLMRVSELNARFSTEQYMKSIYVNKRALYKKLTRPVPPK